MDTFDFEMGGFMALNSLTREKKTTTRHHAIVNFSILRQSQSACLLKFPKPLTSYDFL